MREILFRGKRCDNGEWVHGYYIRAEHHWHKHGIHKDWIVCGASAHGGWFALHNKYAVKDETVGQYTGLKDKNGKMIWEGDVIKWDYTCNEGKSHQVRYDVSSACFVASREHNGNIIDTVFYNDGQHAEVIGNIHDNPELLENP